MQMLLWTLFCVLAVIGLAQCIGWGVSARRGTGGAEYDYRIIPLYDNPLLLEQQLRSQLARLSWSGSREWVVLVDMGLGAESREICGRVLEQNPGLLYCEDHRLAELIRERDSREKQPG